MPVETKATSTNSSSNLLSPIQNPRLVLLQRLVLLLNLVALPLNRMANRERLAVSTNVDKSGPSHARMRRCAPRSAREFNHCRCPDGLTRRIEGYCAAHRDTKDRTH